LDSFCQRIIQRAAIAVKSLQHTDMVAASTRSWHVQDVTAKYASNPAKIKD